MREGFRAAAAAFILAAGVSIASAQTSPPVGAASDRLSLTQAQETTILLRLENEQPQSGEVPDVGGVVSDAIKLKPLPSDVGAQIPEAERFHYAKIDDRIVLVDPGSKTVVKVIRPQEAATGVGGVTGPGSATSGSGGAR